MSSLGDFFLIASGESAPQVKAISENIVEKLRALGSRPWHIEEDASGKPSWILLDYGDVVVHIFHEETRKRYNLERLWGDAPQRRFRPKARKKVMHVKRTSSVIKKKKKIGAR